MTKSTTIGAVELLARSGNNFDQSMLAALSRLSRLQVLYLRDNQISDIRPLAHLSQLSRLYLKGNQIVDTRSLVNLITLQLSDNKINSVTALFNLGQAKSIDLTGNPDIRCLYLDALDMILGVGVVKRPDNGVNH